METAATIINVIVLPQHQIMAGPQRIYWKQQQSQGEFFSPNYPYNYPNNARCTWTLLGGEMQVVSLTFTSVDLESCCDHIRVYDGPNTQHTLLGSVTGNQTQFNSSNSYMTVFFSTDHSVTRQGFRAEWTFKSCGGRLYDSGSISSPYYPSYYHDNAQCVWQLSAPPGQTIFLSFHDFDLERCCNCDYVNVYDGPSTASHLIEKLCHNNTTHLDFQSSSSYMTVLFRSDYSGVGRGFKAYFSSSLNPNTGHVDCSSDWMNIAIRKSYLDSLGFNWYDLYLDDHRCRASADYYNVTFNFPLHSCSTRRKFSFRAFKFLRTHNQVFLRCDVIICADNDYNSRCRQGCRYRRKRSLSSDHHTAVVTLGPITQKDPEEAVAKTEDKE
ncbi:hypothetical protein PGIGA_G00012940 [Pangasianodon gigas]|uniref:Uncharacterized protein n=1 Tax=Pangasianodon gigas TaxID=30993 RepID=A0ACC5WT46_PANGG|nr:hypothetical protein [Pangasianodon gigas]